MLRVIFTLTSCQVENRSEVIAEKLRDRDVSQLNAALVKGTAGLGCLPPLHFTRVFSYLLFNDFDHGSSRDYKA